MIADFCPSVCPLCTDPQPQTAAPLDSKECTHTRRVGGERGAAQRKRADLHYLTALYDVTAESTGWQRIKAFNVSS